MDIQWLQAQRQFHMHQKVTMMVNRYEIFADDGAGNPGPMVGFAEQKRMTFKEQVSIYTDPSKQYIFAAFKARKVIDLASAYDVVTPEGQVGVFGKKFGKSLLRSTWQLDQPGRPGPVMISERSMGMALFRRVWDFLPWIGNLPFPWKYHFNFAQDTTQVGTFEKKTRFRDHYLISIDDPSLDRRLVLAQAVALDALQSR